MTTYQGPHVSVRQEFQTSPGAVAIESLPPTNIGTAYDVYTEEALGDAYGIVDRELAWVGDNPVVYDHSVAGEREYDFYPVKIYAETEYGDIEITDDDISVGEDGITFPFERDGTNPATFEVPGTEQAASICEARMPYYELGSSATTIASTSLDTVNVAGGALASANLVAGMCVFVLNAAGTAYTYVGTLRSAPTSETSLKLASPYTAAITDGTGIVVGAAPINGAIHQGLAEAGAATTINLDSSATPAPSSSDDIYNGQTIKIVAGTGAGQERTITDYVGSTKVATVSAWDTNPDNTSYYIILPDSLAVGDTVLVANLIKTSDILYDPNANFESAEVTPGDLVSFSTLVDSGSLTDPINVSVFSRINRYTLRLNTLDMLASNTSIVQTGDYLIERYVEMPSSLAGAAIAVRSYSIQRFIGFSETLLFQDANVTAIDLVTRTITVTQASCLSAPQAGDVVLFVDSVGDDNETFSYPRSYIIESVSESGSNYIIVVSLNGNTGIYESTTETATNVAIDDRLHVFRPVYSRALKASYRAIRSEEREVVKRIESVQDIFNAFVRSDEESISPYNELAYMTYISFIKSGRKVCYSVNVDSDSDNILTSYGNALEELELIDSYSHTFGTTDPGVNALMSPYVNSESEPYQGHEKIGILTYDERDAILMGQDTGSIDDSTGDITLSGGAYDPQAGGVTVNDTVRIYDDDGVYVGTATVTATPTSSTSVSTDWEYSGSLTGTTFKFMSGRKSDQATRIKNLGAISNRRVSVVWPGWFLANYGNDRIQMPPYFISAAIAGMDSGIIVSQSFTNMGFDIPGISNIQLDTNSYFKKSHLDTIGSGGIDIMIQDASISQTIKPRHDLTTNMDAVQYRERSITKQADLSAKTLRAAVAPYVGKYNITQKLIQFLGTICNVVSTTLTKKSIIYRFTVDNISRDEVIDDKINFYTSATVFIAGNYYDITMLVKSR